MTTKKNPGLSARMDLVKAAVAVSAGGDEKPVAISIRFPKALHEELRRIAYEERVSIHSLILKGVEAVIAEQTR